MAIATNIIVKENPAFKVVEFDHFKTQARLTGFALGISRWIEIYSANTITVKNIAEHLILRFCKIWSKHKLLHCIRSAYNFSKNEIVYEMRTQFICTNFQ